MARCKCPLTHSHSVPVHSARGKPIPGISSATHPSFPPVPAITATRVQNQQMSPTGWLEEGANLAKIWAEDAPVTPEYWDEFNWCVPFFQNDRAGETSGTGMSVLTRGNEGHGEMANYACRRQLSAVKTNEPSALKPAHELVIFCQV